MAVSHPLHRAAGPLGSSGPVVPGLSLHALTTLVVALVLLVGLLAGDVEHRLLAVAVAGVLALRHGLAARLARPAVSGGPRA